jgi:ribonuclease HI
MKEYHDEDALIIYTDGSMLSKPRRAGGYAFRLIWVGTDGHECYDDNSPDGELGATSNEMELTACVEALRLMTGRRPPVPPEAYRKIVFFVDSAYVHNHIGTAETAWPRDGWINRAGEPVLNGDLWKELVRLKRKAGRVEFRKVKAHQRKEKRNPHNHEVDRLAKDSARRAQKKAEGAPLVTRKTSSGKTVAGSVPMEGQIETIRIVSEKRVPRRRPLTTQYKYEVVRPDSASFGLVDDAFAEDTIGLLRRNGLYDVRFASSTERPGRWIEEIVKDHADEPDADSPDSQAHPTPEI